MKFDPYAALAELTGLSRRDAKLLFYARLYSGGGPHAPTVVIYPARYEGELIRLAWADAVLRGLV